MSKLPGNWESYLQSEQSGPIAAGNYRIGLVWPDSYETGMASLGFISIWKNLNCPGVSSCERYFFDPGRESAGRGQFKSLDSRRPLGDCDVVAVSLGCEANLGALVQMLRDSGIEPLAARRSGRPFVITGGAATRSNPALLRPFADVVVCGDGEDAVARLLDLLGNGQHQTDLLLAGLRGVAGVWLPDEPQPAAAACRVALPLVSPFIAPRSAFGDMRVVELARGCPRSCGFCICGGVPFRQAALSDALAALLPVEDRLGLLGAGIADYQKLPELVTALADAGKKVSVSSVRADRITDELADGLFRCGLHSLTVALDGPSARLRDQIGKQLDGGAFLRGLAVAAKAGLHSVKIYGMVGLPSEQDDDLAEMIGFLSELFPRCLVTLSLSPFVPKQSTPMAAEAFAPLPELTRKLAYVKKLVAGRCKVSQISPKEAWVEHLLSHVSAGVVEAWADQLHGAMTFSDWRGLSATSV